MRGRTSFGAVGLLLFGAVLGVALARPLPSHADTLGYRPCPREPLDARLSCIERKAEAALEVRIIVGMKTGNSTTPVALSADELWKLARDASWSVILEQQLVK